MKILFKTTAVKTSNPRLRMVHNRVSKECLDLRGNKKNQDNEDNCIMKSSIICRLFFTRYHPGNHIGYAGPHMENGKSVLNIGRKTRRRTLGDRGLEADRTTRIGK
jgi:hypothetical protein